MEKKTWSRTAWFKQGMRDKKKGLPIRHPNNADYMDGYKYTYSSPFTTQAQA